MRLPDLGRAYAGELVREAHAGDTPPLMQWGADTPARRSVLRQAAGRLRAHLRPAAQPTIEVLAPPEVPVTCVRWESPGRSAAYLVNAGDAALTGVPVALRCRAARTAVTVFADGSIARCATRREQGRVLLALPRFRTWCVVLSGLPPDGAPRDRRRTLP